MRGPPKTPAHGLLKPPAAFPTPTRLAGFGSTSLVHCLHNQVLNLLTLTASPPEAASDLSSCSHLFPKLRFLLFVLLLQFLQAGSLL